MKNHKEFDKVKPYSYLIYQISTGKYYYGIRWKNVTKLNKTPLEDFWIGYKTSSGNIKKEIKENGIDDFEVSLRQTFDTIEEADAWEKKFLRKVKALKNQNKWWNGNVGTNKVATPIGRKKISERHKGVPKSEDHKNKIRASNMGKNKGRIQTEEHRRKNSEANSGKNNPMYGKPCSPERAANISKAKKGKPAHNKGKKVTDKETLDIIKKAAENRDKEQQTCEVCCKTMAKRLFKQYGHGPDCKMQRCPHCLEYHGKTKYESSHGDKCRLNPNRAKPFVPKPKNKKA